jgi:prepilin-type N-terminal cleavage/methylation domain-containing protein
MSARASRKGFTLIELMIVVAIIAIIASVALPRMMAAKVSSNESAAIATLRSLMSAQAQLQSSGAIDTDSDGTGEYGYFAELSGIVPLRVNGGATPTAGTIGLDELDPAVLSAAFGVVQNSRITRSGYFFQIYLPDALRAPQVEDPTGGAVLAFPDSSNSEFLWCAYAWPIAAGQTGNRAFFANQATEVLQYNNRAGTYSGALAAPLGGEVFTLANDMSSPIGLDGTSVDGMQWVPVQ